MALLDELKKIQQSKESAQSVPAQNAGGDLLSGLKSIQAQRQAYEDQYLLPTYQKRAEQFYKSTNDYFTAAQNAGQKLTGGFGDKAVYSAMPLYDDTNYKSALKYAELTGNADLKEWLDAVPDNVKKIEEMRTGGIDAWKAYQTEDDYNAAKQNAAEVQQILSRTSASYKQDLDNLDGNLNMLRQAADLAKRLQHGVSGVTVSNEERASGAYDYVKQNGVNGEGLKKTISDYEAAQQQYDDVYRNYFISRDYETRNSADFAEKSKYNSNYAKLNIDPINGADYRNAEYFLVNSAKQVKAAQQKEEKDRTAAEKAALAFLSLADQSIDDFATLTQDEIAMYNYIYATEGWNAGHQYLANLNKQLRPGVRSYLGSVISQGIGDAESGIIKTARALDDIIPWILEGEAGVGTGPINQLTDDLVKWYDEAKQQSAENINRSGEVTGFIGNNILSPAVQVIPQLALAFFSGGSTSGKLIEDAIVNNGGQSVTMASALTTASKALAKDPQFWLSAIQMYGPTYEDSINNGASFEEATLTATLNALLGSVVEVSGGVEELFGGEIPTGADALRAWVKSTLEEGNEEVIQQIIEQLTKKAVYDADIPIFSTEDQDAVINPEVLALSFLGGASGGAFGGSVELATNLTNILRNDQAIAREDGTRDVILGLVNMGNQLKQSNLSQETQADIVSRFNDILTTLADQGVNATVESDLAEIQNILEENKGNKSAQKALTIMRNLTAQIETDAAQGATLDAQTTKNTPAAQNATQRVSDAYMTTRQQTAQEIASKAGFNVVYEDLPAGENGYYDPQTRTVHISNSDPNPVHTTLMHELSHFSENAKNYWTDFANPILESQQFQQFIKDEGYASVQEYKQHILDLYSERGYDLREVRNADGSINNLAAEQEMVANFVGQYLFAENTVGLQRFLSEMTEEKRSRFSEWVRKALNWISSKFSQRAREAHTIREFEKRFVNALKSVESGETFTADAESNTADTATRNSPVSESVEVQTATVIPEQETVKEEAPVAEKVQVGEAPEEQVPVQKTKKRTTSARALPTPESIGQKIFNQTTKKEIALTGLDASGSYWIGNGAVIAKVNQNTYESATNRIAEGDKSGRAQWDLGNKFNLGRPTSELKKLSGPAYAYLDQNMPVKNQAIFNTEDGQIALNQKYAKYFDGYEYYYDPAWIKQRGYSPIWVKNQDGETIGYMLPIRVDQNKPIYTEKLDALNMRSFPAETTEFFQPPQLRMSINEADRRYSLNDQPPQGETLEEIAYLTPEDASTTPRVQPTGTVRGDRVSKFYDSVQEADIFNATFKEEAKKSDFLKFYEGIANEDTMEDARKLLETKGRKFVSEFFATAPRKMTATDIAAGFILMSRYQAIGDYAGMTAVAEKLKQAGTAAGQTVQAFAILGRMTPEGMTYYAQTALDQAYEEMVKNRSQKWIEQNKDRFKLTPDEIEFIRRRVWQAAQLPDGRDKRILLAEISKMLQDKIPPMKGDSLRALQRINMLLNVKTNVRNVLGNAVVTPLHIVSDFVGSGIDKAISNRTGTRTTAMFDFGKDTAKAFARGAFESYDDFRRKINTRVEEANKYEVNFGNGLRGKSFNENTTGILTRQRNALNRALNGLDRVTTFLLDFGDRPFFEMWFTNSLNGQMRVNNVDEPTPNMIEIATQEALQRTWQDDNAYTRSVQAIKKTLNRFNVRGFGLGDIVIKFTKTPANLTKGIIDFSPLGLVKAIAKDATTFSRALKKGEATPAMQRALVSSLSKGITGTILTMIFVALAQAGIIRGKNDDDKDVAAFEKNVLGLQPYSVRIGDKTFTYDWAQPIGPLAAMVADVVTGTQQTENADLFSVILEALKDGGNILMDQSFMQSIQNILQQDNIGYALLTAPINDASVMVPQVVNQIASFTDPYVRQTYVSQKDLQTALNRVIAKIPFLRETLPASVSVMGNEVENQQYLDPLNAFAAPANVRSDISTEEGQEIYRVYQATGEQRVIPPLAPNYVTRDGEKTYLTNEQKAEYQITMSGLSANALSNAMNSSAYKDMTDDAKADYLSNLYSYTKDIAEYEVLGIPMSDTNAKMYANEKSSSKFGNGILNNTYASEKVDQIIYAVDAYNGSRASTLSSDYIKSRSAELQSRGMSQEEADKEAKSDLRAALTREYKPKFQSGKLSSNQIIKVREALAATGAYGNTTETYKAIAQWAK